jgi:peptidoglycan/xylan/chitin deacetylase (PgdA/CDA1 family)
MLVNSLFRMLGRIGAPGGDNARLTVLLYHRVLRIADPLLPSEPDAVAFDQQMAILARLCNVLPLAEALERVRRGALPERAVSITFDDGYRDNLEVAMPILQRHGLDATFFIASGFLDGGRMMHDTVIETVRRLPAGQLDLEWIGLGQRRIDDLASRLALIGDFVAHVKYLPFDHRRDTCERFGSLSPSDLPTDLMMTSAQVRQLHSAGMHIGAHTHDHPILAKLNVDVARRQIAQSRDELAGLIGSAPRLFAYPNGKPTLDYSREHVELVREAGFDAAVSVAFGCATRDSDHFQIPRFIPWDRNAKRFALRVLTHPLRNRSAAYA